MDTRNKFYSIQFKYEVLQEFGAGTSSIKDLTLKYGISVTTFREWLEAYERHGLNGFKDSKRWKNYSKELKQAAVKAYISSELSQKEIVRKYEISSTSVLRRWIKQYNCHRELKDTGKRSRSSMTKGRKTTWKERIEIVQVALANGKNYHQTAEAHNVSYQQVYQWVQKYESGGWDALKDRRGRKKDEVELTSEEKMKLKIRGIEKENERLRMENAFLKKLEEIERRRK